MTWGDNDYNGFLKQDFIFVGMYVCWQYVSLICSLLLTKDFQISNASKIPEKMQRRAEEEAKRNLKKLEQRVSEQERSVRNVSDSPRVFRAPSWQREAEASVDLEFIGHEYDVITVQIEKKGYLLQTSKNGCLS